MKAQHRQIVELIQAGTDPIPAVAQTYSITPEAAQKRLTRILKHHEVYHALKASPVRTATESRKLMADVWISPKVTPAQDPDELLASVRSRLRSLLFEGAAESFTPDQWASLVADIRTTDFFDIDHWVASDYSVLSHALADIELEGNHVGRKAVEPHPEFCIPRDLMSREDLELEAWPDAPNKASV